MRPSAANWTTVGLLKPLSTTESRKPLGSVEALAGCCAASTTSGASSSMSAIRFSRREGTRAGACSACIVVSLLGPVEWRRHGTGLSSWATNDHPEMHDHAIRPFAYPRRHLFPGRERCPDRPRQPAKPQGCLSGEASGSSVGVELADHLLLLAQA